jgi:RNA polymerase sigma factor (sigma-70 family)
MELLMAETPPSLLERVQQHPDDPEAWKLFHDLYRPLLASWIRRYSIQAQDADDLLQDIFQTLLRELPHFRYDPAKGRFRTWLRSITVNQLRDYWRSQKNRPVTGDCDFYDNILCQATIIPPFQRQLDFPLAAGSAPGQRQLTFPLSRGAGAAERAGAQRRRVQRSRHPGCRALLNIFPCWHRSGCFQGVAGPSGGRRLSFTFFACSAR